MRRKIVFNILTSLFFFFGLFFVLQGEVFGYSCPDGNVDVICHDGAWCPADYELFSSELKCDPSFRCCIKKDTDQCPAPAFCSTEDLGGMFSGYKEASGGGCTVGKCWVFTLSTYNECTPSPPDYCTACADSNGACLWSADCGSLGSGEFCWRCVPSAMCGATDECTIPDQRECRIGTDAGACSGEYGTYVLGVSCGESGKVCCQKSSTFCSPPAECLSSCPPATHNPVQGISCEDTTLKCCMERTVPADEPGKPKNLVYNGPVIDELNKILGPLAKILYYGGLFIGVSFIVYSGYLLMTSQGNPQQTQDAQEQLTAAILGIIFILLSAAILRVIIKSIIGADIDI